jgi:hypothetical protein
VTAATRFAFPDSRAPSNPADPEPIDALLSRADASLADDEKVLHRSSGFNRIKLT